MTKTIYTDLSVTSYGFYRTISAKVFSIPHALLMWPWHSPHEVVGVYVPCLKFKQTCVNSLTIKNMSGVITWLPNLDD